MAEMETQPNMATEIMRRKAIVASQDRNAAEQAASVARAGQDKPRATAMHPSRMKLAEYERQEWIANAEHGHTVEDLMVPGYWAHMAAQMNPYDHIEVRAEDGSWIADLIVIQVDRNWAKVMLRAKFDLVAAEALPSGQAQHKVEWKGPQHRFCVIRLSDSVSVRGEFKTKEEAISWMREHERVIAG